MKTLYVKGVEDTVIVKLDELARQKGLSRSEYIRTQLSNLASFPEVMEVENKYETLITNIGKIISEHTAAIIELQSIVLSGGNNSED